MILSSRDEERMPQEEYGATLAVWCGYIYYVLYYVLFVASAVLLVFLHLLFILKKGVSSSPHVSPERKIKFPFPFFVNVPTLKRSLLDLCGLFGVWLHYRWALLSIHMKEKHLDSPIGFDSRTSYCGSNSSYRTKALAIANRQAISDT
jgi:hypothetical protein